MGAAAVAAAKAVNYVGAGTVEFIVEQSERGMDFFFMEMNTRLQVEHPVTEAVTGLDLVEWQLRIASGEPLPLTQAQVTVHGHAIEARICAETPDNDFLPAIGLLHVLQTPPASRFHVSDVRWDSGVRQGDSISPYYDSMIAKLIVHGETREQALARLDMALAQLHIVGVQNNVAFIRRVIRTDSFAKAHLDTALIEREKAVLFHQQTLSTTQSIAAVVAALLRDEQHGSDGWIDPWSVRQSWLMQGRSVRNFQFDAHGEKHTPALTCLVREGMRLQMAGQEAAFSWRDVAGQLQVTWGEQHFRCHVYQDAGDWHVFTETGESSLRLSDPLSYETQDVAVGGNLTAPMPGKLLSFAVKTGDKVVAGQALAVMEAMKMEHTVAAPVAGTVAELLYVPGDQVAEGAPLLRLSTD
jgi:3-methylcrotonyl-CoA carboxylase alpha subunit